MHKMTPININRNFFRTNKFEFDSDGKMTKLYIKFLATTDKVGRDFFDNEYSELVDRIITALEKK